MGPRLQVFGAGYVRERDDPAGVVDNCRMNARLWRLLAPRCFAGLDLGVTTNPLHYDTVRSLDTRLVVYDCLDRYEDFFAVGHPLRDFVVAQERRLLAEADFVFASARVLWAEKSRARKVFYLPHGVEVEFFERNAGTRPAELQESRGPVVGFVGGIEHWVNLEWVAAAADAMPEAQFVFVGDVRVAPGSLPARRNIRFLGYRPYAEVPGYVAGFDVAIVPFRINALTAGVNPIKVLEYFALGKPVVASYMEELEHYRPHLVLTRSTEEFVQGVRQALNGDTDEQRRARQEIARSRSWRRIAESFMKVVTGAADATGF
jgi:glycosyltransferase involved in cell wall biosynthesis